MRPFTAALFVLLVLLSGCARVREVDIDSGASRLAEITAAASGRSVSVELTSGLTRDARDLEVGVATTCWTERDRSLLGDGSDERVCVPTSEVRRIVVPRRVRGGFQGAGLGLGSGAVVLVAGYAAAMLTAGTDDGMGFLIYAVPAGAVVGSVMGVVRGKDVYVLNP